MSRYQLIHFIMISKLELFYQNVRGLRTKTMQFKQNLLTHNYDVILITESWLTDGIYKGELCDSRYNTYRCDRSPNTSNKKIGGGVMICTRCELQAQEQPQWACAGVECLWVTVPARSLRVGNGRNLHICVVYIPPDASQLSRLVSVTNMLVSVLTLCPDDYFIVTGDFNLPNVNWTDSGPVLMKRGSVDLQNTTTDFLDMCSEAGFTQHNLIANSSNNILDLIFSNTSIGIAKCNSPLVAEDTYHPSLELDASDLIIPTFKRKSTTKYNFHRADYSKINNYLSTVDWSTVLIGETIDEVVNNFYRTIQTVFEQFVPKVRINSSNRYPTWYSKALVHIITDKLKAHSRWKLHGNPRDYDEFSELRARQKRTQKKCKDLFIERMQCLIKKDPKCLWTYVKSLRKSDAGYPSSMTLANISYRNELDVCRGFNSFFESVFQRPASSYDNLLPHYDEPYFTAYNLDIDANKVLSILKSLDISKGSGCDGVPSVFIRNCAETLAQPLCNIFMLSVNTFGSFPAIWKEARIVPIHKGGIRSRIEHYRPISILNTFSKVFEKIIYRSISPLIFSSIPEEQHGFMNRRSTVTNLTVFSNYILRSMDDRMQIDVIYTDFEKAFDRVDHIILLHKLQALGIRGDLHRWFFSYISNRRQAVVIGSARSDYTVISSGVPQGSILGPLLYNAYLFDISTCFNYSKYIMFADDKKIYLKIKSVEDCRNVQKDLNKLAAYYDRNRINVNISKCLQVTFTRKPKPVQFSYSINNVLIKKVASVRDLGIALDSKMTLSAHVDAIADKAYKQLGFIKRVSTPFKSISCIKVLYFAYVRSVLEYACSIWSPCYIVHIQRLESIQKKFVKYLSFKDHKLFESYGEACRHYGIDTLEQRRRQYDIMLLHDIWSGNIDCPELLASVSLQVPSYRTRHTPLLHVPHVGTNYAQNSVLCRAARIFNKYYSDLDIFHLSKISLKQQIKKIHRSDLN